MTCEDPSDCPSTPHMDPVVPATPNAPRRERSAPSSVLPLTMLDLGSPRQRFADDQDGAVDSLGVPPLELGNLDIFANVVLDRPIQNGSGFHGTNAGSSFPASGSGGPTPFQPSVPVLQVHTTQLPNAHFGYRPRRPRSVYGHYADTGYGEHGNLSEDFLNSITDPNFALTSNSGHDQYDRQTSVAVPDFSFTNNVGSAQHGYQNEDLQMSMPVPTFVPSNSTNDSHLYANNSIPGYANAPYTDQTILAADLNDVGTHNGFLATPADSPFGPGLCYEPHNAGPQGFTQDGLQSNSEDCSDSLDQYEQHGIESWGEDEEDAYVASESESSEYKPMVSSSKRKLKASKNQSLKERKLNKDGTPRKSRQPRSYLIKWDDKDYAMALMGIVYACGENGIRIPFKQAAQLVSPTCSQGGLQQALLKLHQRLNQEGKQLPRLKMHWPQKPASLTTRTVDPGKVPRRKPTMREATQSHIITLKRAYHEADRIMLGQPHNEIAALAATSIAQPKSESGFSFTTKDVKIGGAQTESGTMPIIPLPDYRPTYIPLPIDQCTGAGNEDGYLFNYASAPLASAIPIRSSPSLAVPNLENAVRAFEAGTGASSYSSYDEHDQHDKHAMFAMNFNAQQGIEHPDTNNMTMNLMGVDTWANDNKSASAQTGDAFGLLGDVFDLEYPSFLDNI